MFPLISILIPAYNVAQYLPQCLDSIVNQTYPQLQVVIVDDGSTDNTLAIAKVYADKYPYIEIYHQENAGVAVAREIMYFLWIPMIGWNLI